MYDFAFSISILLCISPCMAGFTVALQHESPGFESRPLVSLRVLSVHV